IVAADVGNPEAALADADDQSARDQPRQPLADRCGADFVALREFDDAEPRARPKIARDDVTLDQCRGTLAERICDGFAWPACRQWLHRSRRCVEVRSIKPT